MKNLMHTLYHIVVVLLSALSAISLPFTVSYAASKFLALWSFVENEKIFLVFVEIAVAVLLILLANHATKFWRDRKLSKMASNAGLALVVHARGFFMRNRIKELKEKNGFGREVMLIGSTGFRTFVDPEGDLHKVLQNCREAKIMLLDPLREGVIARAKSIAGSEISPESFREQIIQSIDFLKRLKAVQKNIRLKLYPETPLFKIAILGDYACVRHYHPGLHVDNMPEYVFKNERNSGSLYNPFFQYFLMRWRDQSIPEYELETDELVYRDRNGNEVRREKFNDIEMVAT